MFTGKAGKDLVLERVCDAARSLATQHEVDVSRVTNDMCGIQNESQISLGEYCSVRLQLAISG